jgi:hypothetical protein
MNLGSMDGYFPLNDSSSRALSLSLLILFIA